jgi:hypothetical protein
MFVFVLLPLAVLVSAAVQAIPKAPKANTPERAIIFFILFKVSCLLQRLIIHFYRRPRKNRGLVPSIKFWNKRQYKFLKCFSQLKKQL